MHQVRIGTGESGQRLDKFLHRYLPAASAGFLYKMLRRKNITVNQKKADGRYLLAEGDTVELFFARETLDAFQQMPKQTRPMSGKCAGAATLSEDWILFQNKDLLLVNKPAGVLAQKAKDTDDSLAELVCTYLRQTGKKTAEDLLLYRPGPANRLDRNTSGLMIFPLSLAAARETADMLRQHTLHKTYLALVRGSFPKRVHMRSWVSRDQAARVTRVSDTPLEAGARAELICEPLQRSWGHTLLEVTLLTGKTHQIRAQLAAAGYPLVGDRKYGKIENGGLHRQFLHAWKLTFPQSAGVLASLSNRTFTAPLPPDLQKAAAQLGFSLGKDR